MSKTSKRKASIKLVNQTITCFNYKQNKHTYDGGLSPYTAFKEISKLVEAEFLGSKIENGTERAIYRPGHKQPYRVDFTFIINGLKEIAVEFDDPTHRDKEAFKNFNKHKNASDEELENLLKEKQQRDAYIEDYYRFAPNTTLIRINSDTPKKEVLSLVKKHLKRINMTKTRDMLTINSDLDEVWEDTLLQVKEDYNIDPADPKNSKTLSAIFADLKPVRNFWHKLNPTKAYKRSVNPINPDNFISARNFNTHSRYEFFQKFGLFRNPNDTKKCVKEARQRFHYVPFIDSKLSKIKSLKTDLYLDDALRHVQESNKAGIPAILITSEYNQYINYPYRINTLDEQEILKYYYEHFFPVKDRVFKC
jgi:predicted transcriptional regulator